MSHGEAEVPSVSAGVQEMSSENWSYEELHQMYEAETIISTDRDGDRSAQTQSLAAERPRPRRPTRSGWRACRWTLRLVKLEFLIKLIQLSSG